MIKKFINKQSVLNVLLFAVYSLLLVFVIEWFSRGSIEAAYSFFRHFFKIFLYNTLIVSVTLSPCFLFKRRLFAFSLVSLVWIVLGIANNFLIKFRETPLTFADLGMMKNAIELSDQYLSKDAMILIASLFIIIFGLLIFIFIKSKKVKFRYLTNILCLFLYLLTFSFLLNYGLKSNIITKNFWDITGGYNTYGFSYSFFNSAINTGIHKPTGYSKNTISDIKNELAMLDSENSIAVNANSIAKNIDTISLENSEVDNNNSEIKPNIVIVQLESFINPNWITDITLNKNPVSNFEALSEEFTSGLLAVPALGGGTANTEFEVITGMSTDFFGAGEFPYNTIASKKAIPSLAYTLKDLGYSANSLHNHEGKFYSRDLAYKNLGFDSFTPIECMNVPERTPVGWAKDSVLIDEICNIITSTDNPDLVFGISVQGHGNYPNDELEDKEIYITNDYSKSNKNSLEYYINQVYEMDQFVGDLIEAVNNLNEPTVIAFYGDHFPAVGIEQSEVSINTLKSTPYLIWDNMNLPKTDKDIEAYDLTSVILNKLSLTNTTLSILHNSDLDDETKKEYLNQLEYDMLYGKNYTSEYEELIPSSNYKIGFKDISISSVEVYNEDNILIKGENFNTYSNVYVNDKYVEKTFIDSNTLAIPRSSCNDGSTVQVRQPSATGSTVFSYSNEVIFNQ
ncbi:sulfatase-like hydrolase/transferase [Clostridium saudiense]|uniref:Sulfatase-like hydrolase/transferase n=1 Tax=Clostridium saudiense TaxID=1414720 RepID=A0ABS2FF39_9CLOT|nr:alkaline phosphatase family protein [Clostridium saudiense]MBM6819049.1 sulfatase-like hydrolase/transferase [Clostridium saudiense]